MAGATNIIKTGDTRVFTIPWRAGPNRVPNYMAATKAMASSRPYGDVTPIQIPSTDAYDQFDEVDSIRGERGRIAIPLQAQYTDELSEYLKMAEIGCALDIQVPMGRCKDPRNFNLGWTKKMVFEDVVITTHGLSDLGALESSERAKVTEDVEASARIRYELKRMVYQSVAAAQVVQSIIDIRVCDAQTCGECGLPSDGCQVVFALTLSAGGSPGLAAEIVYTDDDGDNWDDTNVSTLAANEDPNELACVGTNLVVISEDSESLHYASIADILVGAEVWAEVTTGFVTTFGPQAIHSGGPRHTWIVGEGGYVYFTDDPTNSVVVQDAGVATTQNLNDVHGCDLYNLVAVGNSNAIIVTRNGGTTWASLTGPSVGVNLNTVFVKAPNEWWVGTAGGRLYYTLDGGETWTQKRFSGDNAGVVRHVVFATDSVGFIAHDTATPLGRIFRTDDGGYSWYRDSEGTNIDFPDNDRVNRIAVCDDAVPQVKANHIWAGGLAGNGTDGIIVKGA